MNANEKTISVCLRAKRSASNPLSFQRITRFFFILGSILGLMLIASPWASQPASAQSPTWSRALKLSNDGSSWFPDITADASGIVHVVWSSETLYYRAFDGKTWTAPNDIAVAVDAAGNLAYDPFRASIGASTNGLLHLFYYHLTEGIGYYTRAPLASAGQTLAWTNRQVIGARDNGYYTAMAIDSHNFIHVIYIDVADNSRLSDVFYRRSEDNGLTWTAPVDISNTPQTGATRLQIMVDRSDTLHASWDEGWDRRSGEGAVQTSRYVSSANGGKTWSSPAVFGAPKTPSMQFVASTAATPNSRIGVWRSPVDDNVYYQTSSDAGKTWSAPAPIPGLIARPANSPVFDQYALARDDQGMVHFALVARRSAAPDSPWNVTQIEWDGQSWGKPEIVFERVGAFPEYPRIAIALGNIVHIVWFTRANIWETSNLDVWHSYRAVPPLNTPAPIMLATPAPILPTATPTLAPTPTRAPMPIAANSANDALPSLSTTAMFPLIAGVSAPLLVILLALVMRRIKS